MQVTTLEEAVNNMNEEMLRTLDLVAPAREVKAKKRRSKPWYNEEIKQQRKILKNMECKWFKYREDSHWHPHKCKRNRYINILKFKKTSSLHQLVKQNSIASKNYSNYINELTGKKDQNPLPAAMSDKYLAEQFAWFFPNKIEN